MKADGRVRSFRLVGIIVVLSVVIWVLPTLRHDDKSANLESCDNWRCRPRLSKTSAREYWPLLGRKPKRNMTLIVYAYHESDNALANAQFFIKHGLHSSADFIFILNGHAPLLEPILPVAPNVQVFRRGNSCFDMGAYGHLIHDRDILASKYRNFILLNASIRGPFLPTWSGDCWSDAWLQGVSESTKIQGMTVNCDRQYHVQSMIIGTDKAGLKSMYEDGTFDCAQSMVVAQAQEVSMTSKIMQHGWNINAWMTALHGDEKYENTLTCGGGEGNPDHLYDGRYFGFNIHPYETIFVKANRDIDPNMLSKLTEWHDRMNYSSYDYC